MNNFGEQIFGGYAYKPELGGYVFHPDPIVSVTGSTNTSSGNITLTGIDTGPSIEPPDLATQPGDNIWIEKSPRSEELVGPFRVIEKTKNSRLLVVGDFNIPKWARVSYWADADCKRAEIYDHSVISEKAFTSYQKDRKEEAVRLKQLIIDAHDTKWARRKEWWDAYGEDVIRACLAFGTILCGGATLLGLSLI